MKELKSEKEKTGLKERLDALAKEPLKARRLSKEVMKELKERGRI